MREQIISLKTSMLAQEAGINMNVFVGSAIEVHKQRNYYRPTQSLFAKLLREKYKIVVDVFQDSENERYTGLWKADISIVGVYQEQELPQPTIRHDHFEHAFELCLQEAIKMIPVP